MKFSWGDHRDEAEKLEEGWNYKKEGFSAGYIRYGGNNIGPFMLRPLCPDQESGRKIIVLKCRTLVNAMNMTYRDVINIDYLYKIKKVVVSLQVDEK